MSRLNNKNWKEITEFVRQRDNNICRRCGARKNLHVHHIVPYRDFHSNDMVNLILVCDRCHKQIENLYKRYGLLTSMKRMISENNDFEKNEMTIKTKGG